MSELFAKDQSFSADLDGPTKGTVKVGDRDITNCVRSFEVIAEVGHFPRVTIELAVFDSTRLESKRTEVSMSSSTRELLIEAGWRSPEGEATDG